jgi:hypothetical protein
MAGGHYACTSWADRITGAALRVPLFPDGAAEFSTAGAEKPPPATANRPIFYELNELHVCPSSRSGQRSANPGTTSVRAKYFAVSAKEPRCQFGKRA